MRREGMDRIGQMKHDRTLTRGMTFINPAHRRAARPCGE
jgi:hypothetical protein